MNISQGMIGMTDANNQIHMQVPSNCCFIGAHGSMEDTRIHSYKSVVVSLCSTEEERETR